MRGIRMNGWRCEEEENEGEEQKEGEKGEEMEQTKPPAFQVFLLHSPKHCHHQPHHPLHHHHDQHLPHHHNHHQHQHQLHLQMLQISSLKQRQSRGFAAGQDFPTWTFVFANSHFHICCIQIKDLRGWHAWGNVKSVFLEYDEKSGSCSRKEFICFCFGLFFWLRNKHFCPLFTLLETLLTALTNSAPFDYSLIIILKKSWHGSDPPFLAMPRFWELIFT